jgi:peptidoglycan/xylan/chitin deacetylase (PgdA/CDA1 family)
MNDPTAVPPRSVLITFDDADVTLLAGGLPHLARQRIPAVVFVPTDFVGGTNAFDGGDQPPVRICSWDQLRLLSRHGVSIQAHSASHRRFTELDASGIRRELQRCKDVLEDRLGDVVEVLAYPFGDMGREPARTEEMLDELNYRAAFLYGGSCPWSLVGSQRFRLARLAMGRGMGLDRELARSKRRFATR